MNLRGNDVSAAEIGLLLMGMSSVEWDRVISIVFSEPLQIDLYTFSLWTSGLLADETARELVDQMLGEYAVPMDASLTVGPTHRKPTGEVQTQEEFKAARRLVRSVEQHVADQFRCFEELRGHLERPTLSFHYVFQLQPAMQKRHLLEIFYNLDEVLCRFVAGKRLGQRLAKDVESDQPKLGIKPASCYRQIENIRRIYLAVGGEDERTPSVAISSPSNNKDLPRIPTGKAIVSQIQKEFLLSQTLAERYCRIGFLCYHRIEAVKKKLVHLTLPDLEEIAAVLIEHWCIGPGFQVDNMLFEELKEVRLELSEKSFSEKYRGDIEKELARLSQVRSDRFSKLTARLPTLLKSFLHIGSGLSRSKDLRELLPQISDEVIGIFQRLQLLEKEVLSTMNSFVLAIEMFSTDIDVVKMLRKPEILSSWQRYLVCISSICKIMFHRYNSISAKSRFSRFAPSIK